MEPAPPKGRNHNENTRRHHSRGTRSNYLSNHNRHHPFTMNTTSDRRPADEKSPARAGTRNGADSKTQGQDTVSNKCLQSRFLPETIEALRHRLPEYLEARGVELRRRGSRLVGLCPVHADSVPSFAVFGSHHETCGCHPCGFTGDVFKTAQWLGRAGTFPEAVKDVAAALGVYLPDTTAGRATSPAKPPQRPAKQPPPPFALTDAEREQIHMARLAFSDAFHAGEPIVADIAASLGVSLETLRHAAHGASGLGLSAGRHGKPTWLCYTYPHGIKWRNPNPADKLRFDFLIGKALAPWRAEWIQPDTETVFITEGESDCLALIEAGLETDPAAVCVASPGTSFPTESAPLFRGKRVVLCFDMDEPGKVAAAKVAEILKPHAREVLVWKGARRHE